MLKIEKNSRVKQCGKRLRTSLVLAAAVLLWVTPVWAINDLLLLPAVKSPRATGSVLLDVTRAGQRLVAVGERGHVLYSDDNGQNWQQGAVPVSVTLTAVHFPGAQKGWAVGHDGVVLHSQDGGENWSDLQTIVGTGVVTGTQVGGLLRINSLATAVIGRLKASRQRSQVTFKNPEIAKSRIIILSCFSNSNLTTNVQSSTSGFSIASKNFLSISQSKKCDPKLNPLKAAVPGIPC